MVYSHWGIRQPRIKELFKPFIAMTDTIKKELMREKHNFPRFFVSSLIIFIAISGFLLPILYVLSLVFTIIAAIKAYKGECWNYPLAIRFFKSPDTE